VKKSELRQIIREELLQEASTKKLEHAVYMLFVHHSKGLNSSEFSNAIINGIKSYTPKTTGEDGVDYTGAFSKGVLSALKRSI